MNTIRIAALLACAAAIGTPLALHAQTAPAAQTAPDSTTPGAHHHHRNPLMKALRTLDLTPQQHQQIAGFIAANKQANQGAAPDVRRSNERNLRTEIQGVLTPAQAAQLKAEIQRERAQAQNAPPPSQ
ncbi:MAG TPA: hypothetical protein VGD50_07700 [Candidatus Baltobacteraceae bacterium]